MALIIYRDLCCDLCSERLIGEVRDFPVAEIRAEAKAEGWRRDKLNRDVCPRHPKSEES